MPSKGIRVAGIGVRLTADRRALSLHGSISNRLWRWPVERVRRLVRGGAHAEDDGRAPVIPPGATPEQKALLERVGEVAWYHSIDLGQGVVTPGDFDHRPYLHRYGFPPDLGGRRVLDVGTWDGFWAFEFERRGADVVAVDIPWRKDVDLTPHTRARLERELSEEQRTEPTGKGFALAHELLGSRVRREALSVYELAPERPGTFDMVHVGDLLIHLKSPVTALERVLSVTRGFAVVSETYYPELDDGGGRCLMDYMSGEKDTVWWRFGLASLRQTIVDAGFGKVELKSTFPLRMRGDRRRMHHAVFWAYP